MEGTKAKSRKGKAKNNGRPQFAQLKLMGTKVKIVDADTKAVLLQTEMGNAEIPEIDDHVLVAGQGKAGRVIKRTRRYGKTGKLNGIEIRVRRPGLSQKTR